MTLQKYLFTTLFGIALLSTPAFSAAPEGIKLCNPNQVQKFYQSLVYSPEYRAVENLRAERVARYQAGTEAPELAKYITAEADPEFETIRLFHKVGGRVNPESQVRMLLIHGSGSNRSHSKAMALMLRHLSDPAAATAGGTLKKMSEMVGYVKVSAEAIDLPLHGVGPLANRFDTPAKTTEWLTRYEKSMKAQSPDIPLVVLSRSASGATISRTIENSPDLVDGFVLMSPVYPGDRKMLDHAIEAMFEDAKINNFTPNMKLVNWSTQNLLETHWTPEFFKGKPVLIMTGSEDLQVSNVERELYRKLAEKAPNIHYVNIQGAGHDVLRTSNQFKEPGMNAYAELYKFLGTQVVRKH